MAFVPKNLCGEHIRKLRLEANMTIAELSEKMAMYDLIVDEAEIERMENRNSEVSDLEVVALSQIFSISPDSLICTT